MLYFGFKNYEEFKDLFGSRIANSGKNVRSNRILLSFLKHEFMCGRFMNLHVSNISEMYNLIMKAFTMPATDRLKNGYSVYHPDFRLDDNQGICEDGDVHSIRYVRKDNGRVFKMKAGKFLRRLLEYEGLTSRYCEQAIIYTCERFAEDWAVTASEFCEKNYTLHVDSDFERIYNSQYLYGDFNSCMTDKDQHSFYDEAVDASAAYITKQNGDIVARCVIFNKVHVYGEPDTIYRLAERQYSSGQDNILKQILVNKLVKSGKIDGYKQVGVDCHSPRSFVLNDGTSISDKHLWIQCNLSNGDTLSYQDSFKWFDYEAQIADNDAYGDFDLATTDREFNAGEWDEYHERYCEETTTVYVWDGDRYNEMQCNSNDLSDFYWCDRNMEYYDEAHISDVEYDRIPYNEAVYCEFKDDYMFEDHARWCEEANDFFHEYFYDEWFEEWKEANWELDEINGNYIEETMTCYVWNVYTEDYDEVRSSQEFIEENFYEYEGEWYNRVNEDGIPFHLVEELEELAV